MPKTPSLRSVSVTAPPKRVCLVSEAYAVKSCAPGHALQYRSDAGGCEPRHVSGGGQGTSVLFAWSRIGVPQGSFVAAEDVGVQGLQEPGKARRDQAREEAVPAERSQHSLVQMDLAAVEE